MAIALETPASRSLTITVPAATWLGVSGLASLGAGAIHAAAIGVHAEHRQAALTFTALAILQLAWGGLALVKSNRLVAVSGALLGFGALGGWIVAKSAGLSFIDGLEVREPIQTADGLAAGLAAVSGLLAVWALWGLRTKGNPIRLKPPMFLATAGMLAVTTVGMVAAGTHVHDHGGAGHTHGDAAGHAHGPVAVIPPHPYDPDLPIDFSGVPGVTPQQQAAAENIVAQTLIELPQWSDPAVAEAHGFRSIGDGFTGVEHFVNDRYIDDDHLLDPDHPEALVYDTSGGGRRLVAAMYMWNEGTPLRQVPNIGGPLMQWHIHNNLCFTPEGRVVGITDGDGNCPSGLVKPPNTPMIHVWIESHECGPFAALEGVGAGQIEEGQTRLCDHVHGSP